MTVIGLLVAAPVGDAREDTAAVMPAAAQGSRLAPEPPVGAPVAGLSFVAHWTDPRALADPFNTVGCEDSAIISADGNTLYFAYSPLDADALFDGEAVVVGPMRAGQKGVGFDSPKYEQFRHMPLDDG